MLARNSMYVLAPLGRRKMDKVSSCIAVFPNDAEARQARQYLLETGFDSRQIKILGRPAQNAGQGSASVETMDEEFHRIGVQQGTLYCYKCLLYGGSSLLIVSGDYATVERACNLLEPLEQAEVALHFNSM